ncbi:putative amidoligase enzyme-domain-containing protein [Thermothelomyces heterothallicus CBS 202.75]|uniref:putative amidoligase enzyme-domain-containing protein n=1 Tax=Thermothelomyces heterothallicus CBS 202.75 TaxID=1149848 RepID=UPI00374259D7
MAANTSEPPSFTFGVEIELLVEPKKNAELSDEFEKYGVDFKLQPIPVDEKDMSPAARKLRADKEHNRTAIRLALSAGLEKAGLPAALDGSIYDTWYVKKEGSLDEVVDKQNGGGYWAIELVSKILNTESLEWVTELQRVFNVVTKNFNIYLTKGCSMHVHVAPRPEWTLPALKRLMKATGVFDEAITKIMPPDRKKNPWARSNFYDSTKSTATKALKDTFALVPSEGWLPLFRYIDGISSMAFVPSKWGGDRNVSWNISAVVSGGGGTVEFRRPPGVKTAAEAQKWAAFTLAFVCAATQSSSWVDRWQGEKKHAGVGELQSFVTEGLRRLGWEKRAVLTPAVLKEDNSTAIPPSAFGEELIKRKLEKGNRTSAFEKKMISSRQNSPASSRPNSSRSGSPGPAAAAGAAQRGTRVSGGSRPRSPAGGNRNLWE